ncbi:8266_t:CDS:2, partial [Funneliformis mosseae]
MHYEYYLGGVVDKSFIPIYLFLSGAGTGKFQRPETKERISNAWVFNISFENGNSLRYGVEKEAYSAIRTRILKQLLMEKHLELIIAEYEAPLPWQMFELLAKYEEIEMKDATIFLIVDGLHSINDWNDQSSDFFRTLTNIHDLALSGAFWMIVEGRALEALQEILEKRDIKKVNVNDLMNDLRKRLRDRYSEAFQFSPSDCRAIGRAMLTRVLLESDKFIPGTSKYPGEVAWPGLISYKRIGETQSGYLIAPYIWICILTQSSDVKLNPKRPPGAQFWQHFEHFVASYRTLKSRMVNDNEVTTIAKIHTGARLNSDDFQFINHHLELEIANHQEDTNSANYTGNKKEIKCDNGIFDVRKGKHCIINGVSAPYDDAFLGLDLNSNIPNPNEVHQYKNLPKNTGYVDKSNWVEYFGPYAGRALTYAHVGSLDINNADKRDLELVEGAGSERADIIFNKRKFIDIDDAYNN